MSSLVAKIEAILFLSTKSVPFKRMAKLLDVAIPDIQAAVQELKRRRNTEDSGIHVIEMDHAVELVTNPQLTDVLDHFRKDEVSSDLTRPQLETLTIVAYRGPITKPEIEHIRGVNCSLILRNLLMRGLIQEQLEENGLQIRYILTSEMLKHLGIHQVEDLPEYEKFHGNKKISEMLDVLFEEKES